MGDEGMDPCECLSHEVAMRRLLSLLRETQADCTDTQCFDTLPNPTSYNNYVVTVIFLAIAFCIFMLRPRSSTRDPQKVIGNNQGSLPPPDSPTN